MPMKGKEETQSVKISRELVKDIKRYIIDKGGNIRSVIESGVKLIIKKK